MTHKFTAENKIAIADIFLIAAFPYIEYAIRGTSIILP